MLVLRENSVCLAAEHGQPGQQPIQHLARGRNGVCGGGYVQACDVAVGGEGDCLTGDDVCTQNTAIGCEDNDDDPSCTDDCDEPQLQPLGDVNSWSDCDGDFCGTNDPLFYPTGCADAGYIPCDGGRCYVCSNPAYDNYADCAGAGAVYAPATVGNCDESDYPCADVVTDEASCSGEWIPFTYTGQVSQFDECMANPGCEDAPAAGDHDECYCSAAGAEWNCVASCGPLGDLNGDGGFNVLDIVTLTNCILANSCNQ